LAICLRVDDELFLAVDDLHRAAIVYFTDVAGVHPAVGIDCL